MRKNGERNWGIVYLVPVKESPGLVSVSEEKKMKCDVCGKSARSFYVYPKGNGEFGVRCVECEYRISKEVAKNGSQKVLY
ncbi:hypothetical protein [Candidatus Avelusimicrobium fimicolum]|uniref:hypothetical protein n=1 Tax=Candidatus Avelusimicrobium fimicolum TaxID=3416216 RepID=UPI003D09DC5E